MLLNMCQIQKLSSFWKMSHVYCCRNETLYRVSIASFSTSIWVVESGGWNFCQLNRTWFNSTICISKYSANQIQIEKHLLLMIIFWEYLRTTIIMQQQWKKRLYFIYIFFLNQRFFPNLKYQCILSTRLPIILTGIIFTWIDCIETRLLRCILS